MQQDCGCFHPNFLDDDANRIGLQPCDLVRDGRDFSCVNTVINQLDAGARTCQCNSKCSSTSYHSYNSQVVWPAENSEVGGSHISSSAFFSLFALDQDTLAKEYKYQNGSRPNLRNNLIKLQLYFSSLNPDTLSETPTYRV